MSGAYVPPHLRRMNQEPVGHQEQRPRWQESRPKQTPAPVPQPARVVRPPTPKKLTESDFPEIKQSKKTKAKKNTVAEGSWASTIKAQLMRQEQAENERKVVESKNQPIVDKESQEKKKFMEDMEKRQCAVRMPCRAPVFKFEDGPDPFEEKVEEFDDYLLVDEVYDEVVDENEEWNEWKDE